MASPDTLRDPKMEPPKDEPNTTLWKLGDYLMAPFLDPKPLTLSAMSVGDSMFSMILGGWLAAECCGGKNEKMTTG